MLRAAACPPDYVLAPLLAAAAALVGNVRWAQAQAGRAEPPHLWCASVGDSGGGKSPGADAPLGQVLPEIERRMALGFPERLREHQLAAELAKMRTAPDKRTGVATSRRRRPLMRKLCPNRSLRGCAWMM